MACTFTYDPNTDIGRVRFEISDHIDASVNPGAGVRPDGSNFCDEDIQYYLDLNDGSILGAAHNLLVVLATAYATQATETELGPFRESYREQLLNIRRQIVLLERRIEEEKNKYKRMVAAKSYNLGIDFLA